jgi:hypothetical protein
MTVIVTMRNQLEPVYVQGHFDKLANEINLQMMQGKKLIAVLGPDDVPLALNVDNINTIRAESAEDAFSGLTT